MKQFLKEHTVIKICLISLFAVLGMVLLIIGWKMTGKMTGLGIMGGGVLSLLVSLYIYNKPFTD